MTDATTGFLLRGTFMHTPRRGEIEMMEDAVVSVDAGESSMRCTAPKRRGTRPR